MPKVEEADHLLRIHPTDRECTKVSIDYLSTPKQYIDISNTYIDLSIYYPEKLLYLMVDEAGRLFGELTRDRELVINSTNEKNMNQ
jgi:hypothetical protein